MYKDFIRKNIKYKRLVFITQISILIGFIIIWEVLARLNLINTFITSSPYEILKTIINLFKNNDLFYHIWITLKETLIAFTLTSLISLIISIILYKSDFLAKVIDPYLTMLNSLPKVALGPILIIWIGANSKSIITMGILISVIVSIETIYNGFKNTSHTKIKLMKTFKSSEFNIFTRLVFPSNIKTIVSTLKINISMSLIGM